MNRSVNYDLKPMDFNKWHFKALFNVGIKDIKRIASYYGVPFVPNLWQI